MPNHLMSSENSLLKEIIQAVVPVLLSIAAIFVAVVITTVFHSLFAPLLDPFPQEALANADRLGKIDVMNAFMEANPYAVYTAIIAHGMGAFAGVFFATRTINAYDRKYNIDRPTWIGPLLVAGMWMYMDIEQDLNLAPVGSTWMTVGVLTTAALSFLAYFLAGGARKVIYGQKTYKRKS